MSKTDQARKHFEANELKERFKIMKGFKLSMSAEDCRVIGIAYECIVHPSFYSFRGQEWIDSMIEKATLIVKNKLTK